MAEENHKGWYYWAKWLGGSGLATLLSAGTIMDLAERAGYPQPPWVATVVFIMAVLAVAIFFLTWTWHAMNWIGLHKSRAKKMLFPILLIIVGGFGLVLGSLWLRAEMTKVSPVANAATYATVDYIPARRISTAPVTVLAEKGTVTFDYSTHSGLVNIGKDDYAFGVKFSKASDTSIHMYKSANERVARVKRPNKGDRINIDQFDHSSTNYTVNIGDIFLIENRKGYFVQIKILSIKDDTRGPDNDEVVFDYQINTDKSAEFLAL